MTRLKILFAEIGLEANTFSVERCDLKRWMPGGYSVGEDVIKNFENVGDIAGGFIRTGRELGVELIPTVAFWNAAPLLSDKARDEAHELLLAEIRKHLGEFDAIALGIHGAGASETSDDLEDYTLTRVRELVGEDMPICVCLDLHGNISDNMIRKSDILMGIKTYPHTDFPEIGGKGLRTLVQLLQGKIRPEQAVCHVPIIIPSAIGCTLESPMKDLENWAADYARKNGLIDATIFHGFAYADVPDMGISVTVVSEKDAQKHADAIGRHIWENRQKLLYHGNTPAEALDKAAALADQPGEGYVVVNDSADNPGGGTPGDGTDLLRELLQRNMPNTIFQSIVDPEIAALAHKAGVGGRISGKLGGKTDHMHGEPIDFEDAEVLNLSNGDAWIAAPIYTGLYLAYGPSARIRIGQVEVVVTTNLPHQNFDDRAALMTGADLNRYRIVCLKSSVHFKGFFRSRAKAIVPAEPRGSNTANIELLPYEKVRRPKFPLERSFDWDPETGIR